MYENAFTVAHAMRHIRGCTRTRTLLRKLYLHDDDNDNKGMDIYGRGGIGVNARAPAKQPQQKKGIEKKKKIEFRSCRALPACLPASAWVAEPEQHTKLHPTRQWNASRSSSEIKSGGGAHSFLSARIWTCARCRASTDPSAPSGKVEWFAERSRTVIYWEKR